MPHELKAVLMALTRRGFFRVGGGVLGAAAFGVNSGLDMGRAFASVPPSPRFDLTQPSYDLFRNMPLHEGTVMQSFTFDNVNRRLFVAQLVSGTTADLCINQLSFAGDRLGYMHLRGFGHGVSIGVQPVGSDSYLWTEVDASGEWGTQLARFKYSAGTTLTNTSSALQKHKPITGVDHTTCAVDPLNNRLVMRYNNGSQFRFAVYDLADVANGDYSNRLADIAQPSGLGTFQGYTMYGSYLYLYDGEAYGTTNPAPPDGDGNTYVTSVDVNTGAVVQRFLSKAGSTLSYREPEGMAIYQTVAGETRLFLGFASGATGSRQCNMFYKNALV
jgi:hypothetical protein